MSDQHEHWQRTYRAHPGMYGEEPSEPAMYAAQVFREHGALEVLELGAGHGRDAIYLARRGFRVTASDFSAVGLAQLREAADAAGLGDQVTPWNTMRASRFRCPTAAWTPSTRTCCCA